ncbi:MAG TPA: pilus assembly protein PilM [Candidatus Omnitrophota bacterium]|nr:pilus assembly protein PilM [Candidatus Omnitrophota bacterium]
MLPDKLLTKFDIKRLATLLKSFFLMQGRSSLHPSRTTVCDLGRSKIILLELARRPDGLFIEKFELIKNPLQDSQPSLLLKPFFDSKKFSRDNIRVTLKGHGVIMRFIRFPKMKREDLKSALQFEVEQYIPFELKDCVMDYAVVDENVKAEDGEKMEILLAVVKRQDVDPTVEIFRNLECNLSVIDVDILSALSALEYFYPEDVAGHVALLDIGTEISTLGIVMDGKPRFIRDISYGTYDVLKRLRLRTSMPEDEIEGIFDRNTEENSEVVTAMTESLEGFIGDLKVSFDYYREQLHAAKPVGKIFISGGGSLHPILLRVLSGGLGIPAEGMEVLSKLRWDDTVDAEQLRKHQAFLPVALGLALRPE